MLSPSLLFSLAALAALVPAALLTSPAGPDRQSVGEGRFWLLIAVAVAGPTGWTVTQIASAWPTGIGAALWLTVAATLVLYGVVALASPTARRLAPLLLGYLFVLGLLATVWQQAPGRPMPGAPPSGWIQAHILGALAAYALLTLAAVAGAGAFLQERAIRRRRPTAMTRRLPSVSDGETLQAQLLVASEIVLAVALATGMSLEWIERRTLLRLDHKTVLSIGTFVLIGILLVLHHRSGLSGRRMARYGLLAYLLITLAYPGVKFVTDVLMG